MTNGKLHSIKGIHYKTGKLIEVIVKDGYIKYIHDLGSQIIEEEKQIIAPGFVDIQINGYKGYDFNQKALIKKEWDEVTQHLLSVGVTTFYPTIITNSIDNISKILKENIKVLNDTNMYNGIIGGFHLEGPYLSLLDGPRGAHEKKHIKAPNWKEFCNLQKIAEGNIKIITVSPEWDHSADFIKKVTNSGVKVAIGHTAANTAQIHEAVEAGAILSTHLGNGTHVELPRHPNYIWDQLSEDRLWASVISDGHHLPDNLIKVFQQVKKRKMILVSDSVALAGTAPGNYTSPVGGEVTLSKSGRLHLIGEKRLLAGSAKNLLQGVQHIVQSNIVSKAEGINKASIYPSNLMGLQVKRGLTVGAPADLIVINQIEDNWDIAKAFKGGKQKV